MKMNRFALVAAAAALLGCTVPKPGQPVDPRQKCVAACLTDFALDRDAEKLATCTLACGVPPQEPLPRVLPSATSTTTSVPTPSATALPTSIIPSVTPTPVVSVGWQVRLRYVNGFGGCNPYPCNPTTAECKSRVRRDNNNQPILDAKGNTQPMYPERDKCVGDRTALYEMPDLATLPQGTGCEQLAICAEGPSANYGQCVNNCKVHDGPGTPCGGAAACAFPERASCPRSVMGCNGMQWDADFTDALGVPRKGSQLTFSGPFCTDGKNPGFAIACSGAPGAVFKICTAPWPDAKTADGRPILGGKQFCKEGWF